MRGALLAALVLIAPGCLGVEGGEPVPFRTLDQGVYSGFAEAGFTVLSTQAEYEAAWARHTSASEPRGPAPPVDFSKERVALAALGDQRGQCDDVRIENVTRAAGKVIVHVVRLDSRSGPEAGCEAVVKQPIHLVAFENATGEVEFEHRVLKRPARWPPPGIPMRPVETLGGATLARGAFSGIHDDTRVLVRDAAAFAALWAQHGKDGKTPDVDFSRESVVAVVVHGPTGCHGIHVGNATYVVLEEVIEVEVVHERTPEGVQCAVPQEDAYEFRAIAFRPGEARFYDTQGDALPRSTREP